MDRRAQCANVESNKTISEKKTTVTASMFNTYRVRNHFVPNPTNSKFIRLKKSSKNNFLLQKNKENARKNEKNCMV